MLVITTLFISVVVWNCSSSTVLPAETTPATTSNTHVPEGHQESTIEHPPSDEGVYIISKLPHQRRSYRNVILSLLLIEDIFTEIGVFEDLIKAALAIKKNLGQLGVVSDLVNWNRYLGPDLIRTTKLRWIDNVANKSASALLLKAVIIIVTSMNTDDPVSFSKLVGFDELCRSRRDRIYRMMLDAASIMEKRRTPHRTVLHSVFVEANMFSSRLHRFCPDQFGDFATRRLILKIRIAHEQYKSMLSDSGVSSRRGSIFEKLEIETSREYAFDDAVALLQNETSRLSQGVRVLFLNEPAEDHGGVTRDWITEMMIQIQGRFFQISEDGFHVIKFNPIEVTDPSVGYLVIGKILGLAFVEGIPVGLRFPLVYMSTFINQYLELSDMEYEDPALFKSLKWLLEASEEQLVGVEVEILSDNFPVDFSNREGVIEAKINCVNSDIDDYFGSLKAGFHSVIPEYIFRDKIISPNELRSLFEGEREIDVIDLWSYTDVIGYNIESPQILWLWDILLSESDFPQSRLKDYFRFLTGLRQPPFGGIQNLGKRMIIAKISRDDPDSTLPSAHTCVYQLNLPEYTSKSILKAKLVYAIEASPQMGFV